MQPEFESFSLITYAFYWQCLDSGPCLIHEVDERKIPLPSRSDVKPQYVHHLAPKPPSEISYSIPKHKGSTVSFLISMSYCSSGFNITVKTGT